MVQLPNKFRVAFVEDGVQDRQHGAPLLARGRAGGGVAHEVHDAALPRGAGEHFLYGAPQALVGIGCDAENAADPSLAQGAQEGEPPGVGLRVDRVQAEQAPVAVGAGPYGRDQRARRHVAAVAALDVGGVDPDVGEGDVGEVPFLQVGHDIVQRLAYPRHLGGAHAVDAERRRHPLHLPRRDPVRHHLGHRGDHRPVDPRVAREKILREVAAAPELGNAQVYGADAGDKPALAVAVAPVAVGAGILCLGVHDLVDEGLGHRAEQLLHVDHAIVESGHLGRIGARNW